jgi:hypothetical protein
MTDDAEGTGVAHGSPPSEKAARRVRRRAPGWVWWAGVVLAFLALAAVLRIPTFGNHVFNTDEAYLATEAQVLDHGGRLYVDVVDRKPPLVPYVYAAAFTIAGSDGLTSVRVLAALAHALTALLLAVEARRRFGRAWTGVVAGTLYLLAATAFRPQDAQAANFEVFMLPLMTAAMLLAIRRRPASGGVTLAAATLAKQTAAVTLLPMVWLAWRARRWPDVIRLVLSFVLPLLVVAALMGFHDFVFWNVTGNGGYLGAGGVVGYAFRLGLRQTGWFLLGHAVIVVLAALAWRHRRDDADLWLWLLSGVVAVLAGLRFFPHYYLQILPPLCLLATRALSSRPVLTRPWVLACMFVVVVATTSLYAVPAFGAHDDSDAAIAFSVARYVNQHTRPDEKVFVWGHAPEVYWASGRRPSARFVTTGYLTGESGGRPPDRVGTQYATPHAWTQFLEDLRRHPPALVVDMSTADQRHARFYPIRRFPQFERYLRDAHYRRVATVARAAIYARAKVPG